MHIRGKWDLFSLSSYYAKVHVFSKTGRALLKWRSLPQIGEGLQPLLYFQHVHRLLHAVYVRLTNGLEVKRRIVIFHLHKILSRNWVLWSPPKRKGFLGNQGSN